MNSWLDLALQQLVGQTTPLLEGGPGPPPPPPPDPVLDNLLLWHRVMRPWLTVEPGPWLDATGASWPGPAGDQARALQRAAGRAYGGLVMAPLDDRRAAQAVQDLATQGLVSTGGAPMAFLPAVPLDPSQVRDWRQPPQADALPWWRQLTGMFPPGPQP